MEAKLKRCSACKEHKSLTEFNKNKRHTDGLQSNCKECSKKVCRTFYLEHKQEYIEKAQDRKKLLALYIISQLSEGCIDCGEKDPVVLDFDHVHGDKVANVSYLLRYGASKSKIDAEIAKCEVRCANCHRRRTAQENNWLRMVPSSKG